MTLAFGMLPMWISHAAVAQLPAGLSLCSSSRKSQWAEEAPVPSASKTRSRERAAAKGGGAGRGEQWIPSIIRMAASSLMQRGGRRKLFAAGSVEERTERWSYSP